MAEPSPGLDFAQVRPLCCGTTRLQMGRSTPVPSHSEIRMKTPERIKYLLVILRIEPIPLSPRRILFCQRSMTPPYES